MTLNFHLPPRIWVMRKPFRAHLLVPLPKFSLKSTNKKEKKILKEIINFQAHYTNSYFSLLCLMKYVNKSRNEKELNLREGKKCGNCNNCIQTPKREVTASLKLMPIVLSEVDGLNCIEWGGRALHTDMQKVRCKMRIVFPRAGW